jgi:hypothetical protein
VQTWLFEGASSVPWPAASKATFLPPSFFSGVHSLALQLSEKGLLHHVVSACKIVVGVPDEPPALPTPGPGFSLARPQLRVEQPPAADSIGLGTPDVPDADMHDVDDPADACGSPRGGDAATAEFNDAYAPVVGGAAGPATLDDASASPRGGAAALAQSNDATTSPRGDSAAPAQFDLVAWYNGNAGGSIDGPCWASPSSAAPLTGTPWHTAAVGSQAAHTAETVDRRGACLASTSAPRPPSQKAPSKQRKRPQDQALKDAGPSSKSPKKTSDQSVEARNAPRRARAAATGASQGGKRKRSGKLVRAFARSEAGSQQGTTEVGFFAHIKQFEMERRAQGVYKQQDRSRRVEAYAVQQMAT